MKNLSKKNYKVFFAEKSLEDRLGSEYEPIIFKALHTSKIFILVGTSKENIEANWVRNEWARFIDRIKTDKDLPAGCFIPVFKDMNPYDMPKVNNTFVQGVDASKLGYVVTIVDGVTKLLKPEKEQKVISAFDDVDNFAEFERIKKQRSKDLKEKRWQELKNSKGIKKWGYYAFLYSPWLFGALAILFGFLTKSKFVFNIEFALFLIILVVLLILTITTVCIQSKRYGLKPILNAVIPFTSLVLSVVIFLSIIYVVPFNTWGEPIGKEDTFGYYKNGIVYYLEKDSNNDSCLLIKNFATSGYEEYIKEIDGKRTLILPSIVNGKKVTGFADGLLPSDVEAVVMPKYINTGSQVVFCIPKNSKLSTVYVNTIPDAFSIGMSIRRDLVTVDLPMNITLYYQSKEGASHIQECLTLVEQKNISFYK